MLTIGCGKNVGLGDLTTLTAIAKQTDCVIELPPGAEKYAILFNDLALVKITENPVMTTVPGEDLRIRDKMVMLNTLADNDNVMLDVNDFMPKINVSKQAIARVCERYDLRGSMYALKINCSQQHRLVRECMPDKWANVLNILRGDHGLVSDFSARFLQLSTSDNCTEIEGLQQVQDLPLDELIAVYHVIGRYVGINTGDWHLAMATGCKCLVFHPGQCPAYNHKRWIYEHPNVLYMQFNEMETLDADLVSDFFG